MLPLSHLRERRAELLERLESPALLFAGGERPRNYAANSYPPRADSNFLLFFSEPELDSAAFFDPDAGTVTLFLPERTVESALWEGPAPSFEEMKERSGVDAVFGIRELAGTIGRMAGGRSVATVAVADSRTTKLAAALTGIDLDLHVPEKMGDPALIDALSALRMVKKEPELEEIRAAAQVTRAAFLEAMGATAPGVPERELAGQVEGRFARGGCVPGYRLILTVRGETLHNLSHDGTLEAGDLVLCDAGAERPSGYGADVTRAWPASGAFTTEQREIYEIVLRAEKAAIDAVRPGARSRDVHFRAAEVIAEGLVALGLAKGPAADVVERGAHALFFPHGVGHPIGLDTHDLRTFGDRILYAEGRERSGDFGTEFLRYDLDLVEGMVVTIEPGLYFVPAILSHPELREKFADVVDFERAEGYLEANGGRGFGGIRIEDDVAVTADGCEILTPGVPREVDEVERAVGETAERVSG